MSDQKTILDRFLSEEMGEEEFTYRLREMIEQKLIQEALPMVYAMTCSSLKRTKWLSWMTEPVVCDIENRHFLPLVVLAEQSFTHIIEDQKALNMAKRAILHTLMQCSGHNSVLLQFARDHIAEVHRFPEYETPISWEERRINAILDNPNDQAGTLTRQIITEVEQTRLSPAFEHLLPLVQHALEQEEQGVHILGVRVHNPEEKMIDVRYGSTRNQHELSKGNWQALRVLGIDPLWCRCLPREKIVSTNMLIALLSDSYSSYIICDLLKIAKSYMNEELLLS